MRNAHRARIALVHVALQNDYQVRFFLPYATNMKSFLFPILYARINTLTYIYIYIHVRPRIATRERRSCTLGKTVARMIEFLQQSGKP